ncbi:hypothetical protein MBANPS3_008609 [Mucor bainieri]
MSTVPVDQDVNKHLVNAVNRLKALQHIHVAKELTSHYNYGTEKPFIRDRFRIGMGLKAKDIRCQVVFDSSNYYSPPDIIFDKSVIVSEVFDVEEQAALLPTDDWDLKNEDCLYNWFEKLVGRLKRPPKSPSLSPPPVPPPKKKKKNWSIFSFEDDSDDDLIIAKEKADSDDDFIPTERSRRSRSRSRSDSGSGSGSNSRNKRPAKSQNDEAKDAKRQKKFRLIGETKKYSVIDLDEDMSDSGVDSKHVDTDIEWKAEEKETKTEPQQRNAYIDGVSTMKFDFGDKSKGTDSNEEKKTRSKSKNRYIDEASAMDFTFDDKPRHTEWKGEDEKAEGSMAAENTQLQQKNPYIDEASTINFDFDSKPKDAEQLKKNPYIAGFEQMEIDEPERKKPKSIDLMQSKKRLTQGPSKVAAMRMQKESKWGKDFMVLWRRKFQENILRMDENDTGSLTLYMNFKIDKTSNVWKRFKTVKEKQLVEFREAQGNSPEEKFPMPRTVAPMIVHLELMSPTRLKATLISVINTSEPASDGVDSIDLTYDLNGGTPVGSELNRIKDDIKEQAIHFHLFQTKLADY